ncbi:MAG: glycosyltransferase [Candidatus Neomarinimicrobiota bacterium]|nr:glycosyltransferase [Candidatus Neomarinimicrobiota bacterium]MEE3196813.1 glycosyltransferase [Candidatus Neomarinimicrobiota bacterium]|tara:strand:+ start:908 stop:1762 length:855 start_codon:yes stop_codon:yes gene_type:complete
MKNNQNSVSVIIPVFNRAKLIYRSINSVINQTCPVNEIIVIDDGSKDGTYDLVKRDFPQVILIHQENKGVSTARNVGIKLAKSKWIAFLDSDDEWLPKKVEKQINLLNTNFSYKICHTDEVWIRNQIRVNPMKKHRKYGGDIYNKCLPLCVISPSSIIIHKDIFNDVGLFDESLPVCEDYDMWLRICSKYSVLYLDQKLINKFGGHDDQLSKKYWGMDLYRVIALEKMIDNPNINNKDRMATINMAINKVKILQKGYIKHDHKKEAQEMSTKLIKLASLNENYI